MIFDYLLDVLSLSLRWLHLVVGIAWIGASFYFVWLDNTIRPPQDPDLLEKGVAGELWALHGGGFYNPQKYAVAPTQLPDKLHWFFWPSYSTFITGFLLISTLYYLQASQYMVDPQKMPLSPATAVLIGLGTLLGGWLVYDSLARLLLKYSQLLFAIVYTLFVAGVSYGLNAVLSGRAAYIHVGAMIASTMTANVFFIIIPSQRIIVAAMARGEAPDPTLGKRAKQRSVHNNYLTLPVLFCMISNHYAFTYNHPWAWLVLICILIGSVLIRHFFNLKHKEQYRWEYAIAGFAIIFTVFCCIMPKPAPANDALRKAAEGPPVPFDHIQPIVQARCLACHSEHPTLVAAAPAGVLLDSPERLRMQASRVFAQVGKLQSMPFGNVTNMTADERRLLAAWAAQSATGGPR